MAGLTNEAADAIVKMIEGRFNSISLNFLGLVPKLTKEKRIVFSTARNSLTSLFLQSLGTRDPSKPEEDTLKVILRIASGYTDALRDRTTSRVLQSIDGYVREQTIQDKPIKADKVREMVEKEMKSATHHFKMITNTESNKAANTGTALQIQKIGESKGEKDPTVFFVVTVDDVTGPEEFVLHLLKDRMTPRLWKLSEIGSSYHKKGEKNPKLAGLHPNCRCKLTYLAKGFGFDHKGEVTYISPDHDEFKIQRKEFALPR